MCDITNMAYHLIRDAIAGLHRVPGRILTQHSRGAINCSPAAWMCSSTTQPKGSAKEHASGGRTEEETMERPEYIPSRKAKNPMMSIGYAWIIGLPSGIIAFVLAKRQVDKNRLKQLKVRQRMKLSNEGDYEGSRYQHQTKEVKLDQ
uniref:Si:ch73-71c20.5 n=1 Tax=Oryzias latipes TaxID=8090 RepID=A0A3P9H6C5_ORYLA